MKKRIGTKIYDTEKGIPVIPEKGLYKQPKQRSFYLFDGETITPLTFDQADKMITETGDPALLQMLEIRKDSRGAVRVGVSAVKYDKLTAYSRKTGISCKKLIEQFIDSLPE